MFRATPESLEVPPTTHEGHMKRMEVIHGQHVGMSSEKKPAIKGEVSLEGERLGTDKERPEETDQPEAPSNCAFTDLP